MFTNTVKAPVETPAERATPGTDLDTQGERGGPQDSKKVRRLSVKVISLAPAALATVAIYVSVIVHPVEHTSLATLQAWFEQGNAAIWPMQLVWYASAAAIVGLALWPRRRASQLIYLLAAAYFAWIGFAYFAVLESGTQVAWVSGLWAVAFILEGMLFLFAGLMRRDLVIAPRRDLASVLGAVFIGYALIAYPLIGLLTGQSPGSLPVIGLAPCPTSIFAFGLLLWARPPAPRYLLLIPLAWGLGAGPGAMS